MRICYVGQNSKKETDELLISNFKELGEVKYVKISNISLLIDGGINFVYEYEDLSKFNIIFFRVPRSKYTLAASILEALPESVIHLNSPRSFYNASSRLSLYRNLSHAGINVPKVIFADNPQTSIFDLKLLRFPILIKVPTDKNKVMLANSQQEAKSMVDALQVLEQPILFEEYYPEARVIQAYVLGDEVIATLVKDPEDINYAGGEVKKHTPSKKIIRTALDVANALNAEYMRVDILDTARPIVIDVNLCPFLSEAIKASGVDIAKKVASYLKSKYESIENASKLFDEVKSMFTP
ncbi:MAG: hypothetical protein J7K73_03505 [Nanoarchaeota archaeon]|nr:hypothetical protein [Nanoarchaeota archaeon]